MVRFKIFLIEEEQKSALDSPIEQQVIDPLKDINSEKENGERFVLY